ncbi:MAG TPA: ribosomal protein S18-alanine N-acetyltransferase [Oscillatoriaceae cyanobacterium]
MAQIRKMTSSDLPRVVQIEKACFGERWTLNSFQHELANAASSYFVAVEDGEIIGYAGYWLILEEAHVTTIGVDPKFQRRGFGEFLMLHLVEHAERAGAKWVTLEVRASNYGAQKMYEKFGFSSLGRRKGYYQDNNEDALIMWTENISIPEYQTQLAALREGLAKRGTTA